MGELPADRTDYTDNNKREIEKARGRNYLKNPESIAGIPGFA